MNDRLAYAGIALAGMIVLSGCFYGFAGVGTPRGESQYTGQVVDVVEDKGLLFRPSWVNMKTNARSSDVQQYCITPEREEELIPKFYDAMESGKRVTVSYERPLWVRPSACEAGQSIVTGIEYVNNSSTETTA